jgi:tetratricopeptide (TPR) repeat protein
MALPARLEQSDTRKAIEETENFEETYPESEYLPEVRRIKSDSYDRLAEKEYLAGRLYRRMGYTSAAIHYFRELEKDFPESRWLARSRYEWALCLYKQGDFADARSMADTSRLRLQAVIVREQDRFVTDVRRGFAYRLFHLFGAIPYETRTPIKIYIDELDTDISNLMRRIDHKLEATALKPGADSGS